MDDGRGAPGASRAVDVPPVVRARAASAPGGQEWVARLPDVLQALQETWSVTIAGFLPGGTASLVARVVTADGRPAVLKVAVPGTGLAQQVRTLLAADGEGYVEVLAVDAVREAVLLEALGVSLHDAGLTPPAQLSVLARCLRRGWRTPPQRDQQPVDKAAVLGELVGDLWHRLGRPCPREVLEYALACADRRSSALARLGAGGCVVVHGDGAAPNAARVLAPRPGSEDGFVLLDPDGFLGDPAYDLGVALRDWCPQLLATDAPARLLGDYCRVLTEHTGADPVAVWEHGFLERVSTGLHVLSLGAADLAQPHLRTAQVLLEDGAVDGPAGRAGPAPTR